MTNRFQKCCVSIRFQNHRFRLDGGWNHNKMFSFSNEKCRTDPSVQSERTETTQRKDGEETRFHQDALLVALKGPTCYSLPSFRGSSAKLLFPPVKILRKGDLSVLLLTAVSRKIFSINVLRVCFILRQSSRTQPPAALSKSNCQSGLRSVTLNQPESSNCWRIGMWDNISQRNRTSTLLW